MRVPLPRMWGTFVIRGDDGRVIIVDREGEFDSGVPKAEEARGKRWVKAQSTRSSVVLKEPSITLSSPPRAGREGAQSKKEKHGHSHRRKRPHHSHLLSPPLEPLMPIEESEYEEEYELSCGEDVASPTGFFMTGGASGWPSRAPTLTASPEKLEPPPRSPTSSWPTPTHSTTTSVASSKLDRDETRSWTMDGLERSHRSESSHHSRRSSKSQTSRKQIKDDMSTRSYSTYKAPTVEEGRDTCSESVPSFDPKGWSGSAREHRSTKSSVNSCRAASENSWDGFEKKKTASEVSVAGSGSERSSLRGRSRSSGRARTEDVGWSSGSANGFDEDNETYLNEKWGGTRVRVCSRRTRVGGWE